MIYWTLFVTAFASATVLPGASEVVLLAAIRNGGHSLFWLWLAGTVGNTLGSGVSWLMGRYFLHWQHKKWFPVSPKKMAQAQKLFNEKGRWTLLLTWLPIVGDGLAVAAGLLRVPWPLFLLLAGIGKAFRYAITIALAVQVWP